ncbi:Tachykinin-like peptides receptor 86C [Stylophora pistillata]|uniref:Tachykinin-like peptides receptor 86C n=1 Tax=Stylophora pistillata TaxID=50429 RepID=A0A2B4R7D9_STYPI|nr:Tachykinin-like peptides receptor 86C [Stylophora pistillata]
MKDGRILTTHEAKSMTSALKEIEGIILTVLYAITMLVTFAGNGFLIYIVWKKPEVRSLTSFMFVNMAIADLLVGLIVMPWSIAQVHTDGLWMIPGVFGEVMCKGVVYIAYATLTASILCLTVIALDRYYTIVHHLRRNLWFRRPKLTVPFIWIFSLASMSIFPAIQTVEDHNSQCMLSVYVLGDPYKAIRGLFLYLVVINYLIPLIVMSFLYTIIARRLWFHGAHRNEHSTENREQQETLKRRIVWMLIIVTSTFALCWLPAHVVHMIFVMQAWNIEVTLQPIVMFVCFWFGHANSAINPWLYIFLSTKMNTAFKRMVCRETRQSPPSNSVITSNANLPPEQEAVKEESRL